MYDGNIADKVCAWAAEVERQAKNNEFPLDKNTELFLEIDDNDCNYYLVDRDAETIFWLTEYTTEELGLKPAISDSHLSKCPHDNLQIRMLTISIRIITGSPILESYRELLHAFWWATAQDHRQPHSCIFTCTCWSVKTGCFILHATD